MASRSVRLEEYASSGVSVESEDIDDSFSSIKIRPMRQGNRHQGQDDAPAARVAYSASASHRQNDKYMEAFDVAFEELSAAEAARTGKVRRDPVQESSKPSSAGKMTSLRGDVTIQAVSENNLTGAWLQGPRVSEGQAHDVSAQPLMCMSMSADESEVVVGSSDHALYVIPLGDRRIISGGMDSKLCLWDATGVKCEDLLGHSGSVSCVLSMGDEMVLSAGYDKMLRLWNINRRVSSQKREQSVIKAGTAPILDVSLLPGVQPSAVCGDRDGSVQLIDLEANKVLRKHTNAHRGHATSVLGSQNGAEGSAGCCYFSGGQDGAVKVWDTRQKSVTHSLELHIDPRSSKAGAVGFLREPPQDPNVLITGGADGVINVLDKRQSYGVLHSFTEHMDFIYSLHVRGQLCFSGAGNGMLHVHDWRRGKLLYGLGANKAAVRAVATSATQLVAAGDDGGVIVYDMN
ncbi:hypothetical protein BBO99_00006681 [Phytophthora kernoviae]|uniref:Uncharacterized protein n=2 Tax=Phytophthora kernoviae TaxID=325452 RepID=A0A3R7MVC6_9STRA|nr:hypothetical protein G195_009901 [Phytophthora kernoviae 00238/432]KAG2514157.1 hypothetical protein JM18_008406 [Phytophthora kernoviae]KAG2522294.1 hypothetical protein JM16_002208 [Phytophthora kernoviae]RLN44148.1 hypothetical protein BBI17_002648 [Phytophthora kernoviae]RLN77504.1 hypothetical protein BBO99_00006681 [Phytophthora kernoviae]